MSSKKEINIGIEIIRILAMFSIIVCHIFQEYNNELAYWLNVGVQIFILISGFLYGSKNNKFDKEWMKKRFKKILIPYYIYIFVIILYYICFKQNYLNIENILVTIFCLQLFLPGIPGLGHLWFIPLILICYLATPLIQKIYGKITANTNLCGIIIKISIIILLLNLTVLFPLINMTLIMNVVCYIIGYFVARLYRDGKINDKIMKYGTIVVTILAIIISTIYILVHYILEINDNTIINMVLSYKNAFNGIAIFMILYLSLSKLKEIKNKILNKILDVLNKYSFEIYITHLIYILGPSSLLTAMNNIVLEIVIISLLIAISAYALHKATDMVTNLSIVGGKNEKGNVSFWN